MCGKWCFRCWSHFSIFSGYFFPVSGSEYFFSFFEFRFSCVMLLRPPMINQLQAWAQPKMLLSSIGRLSTRPSVCATLHRSISSSPIALKGHSKWQNIKATKGKNDLIKSQAMNHLLKKVCKKRSIYMDSLPIQMAIHRWWKFTGGDLL